MANTTTQTELNDYESTEVRTDGGVDLEGEHFDADAETVTDAWEGVFLYTSWGYGQTNTNFAQIVDVSDSGKTVLCRRVAAEVVETGHGSESVRPDADQFGPEFRLHVRNSAGDVAFRGSYPYIYTECQQYDDGEIDAPSTRKGSFGVFQNTPGKTVHQTAPGYKH